MHRQSLNIPFAYRNNLGSSFQAELLSFGQRTDARLCKDKELSDTLHHHCFAARKASSGFTVGRPLALPAFARLLDILQVSLTGLSDYCRSL